MSDEVPFARFFALAFRACLSVAVASFTLLLLGSLAHLMWGSPWGTVAIGTAIVAALALVRPWRMLKPLPSGGTPMP